mgnify:FL=1
MPSPSRSSESRRPVSQSSLLARVMGDIDGIMGAREPISAEDSSLLRRQAALESARPTSEAPGRRRSRSPPRTRSRPRRNDKLRSNSVQRGLTKNTRRKTPGRKNKTPSPNMGRGRMTRRVGRR